MTLIIITNDRRHVWQTGDPLSDLEHGLDMLQQYYDEQKQLEVTTSQLSIPTAYDVPNPP